MQFVWDTCVCRTLAEGVGLVALMAEAPGTHMHYVRVQVTAWGQPKMSLWPPDLPGRGMAHRKVFPRSLGSNTA